MTLMSPPTTSQDVAAGPPPPFDPECAAVLSAAGDLISPSLTLDQVPAMRAGLSEVWPAPTVEEMSRDGAFTVEDRSVPGPDGAPEISLLICRPTSATAPVAAVYHVHGGGMIMGDDRNAVPELLDWAQDLELAVVSVEYRLAPETPHPGPVEDCYAGLVWTAEHADELGIDPARIVVAGASAGGGLAAAVALLARDRGGPALAGQRCSTAALPPSRHARATRWSSPARTVTCETPAPAATSARPWTGRPALGHLARVPQDRGDPTRRRRVVRPPDRRPPRPQPAQLHPGRLPRPRHRQPSHGRSHPPGPVAMASTLPPGRRRRRATSQLGVQTKQRN